MKIRQLHAWPRNPLQAARLGAQLCALVGPGRLPALPRLVAGIAVHGERADQPVLATMVVMRKDGSTPVEVATISAWSAFPPLPGLLSFRELPAVLGVCAKLRALPDVLLCNRHGMIHPGVLGLASHLGLWLNLPTVGVSMQPPVGDAAPLGRRMGDSAPWVDDEERVVGLAVRTQAGAGPLFVSAGHLMSAPEAGSLVMGLIREARLPEPLRLALLELRKLRKGVAGMAPVGKDGGVVI